MTMPGDLGAAADAWRWRAAPPAHLALPAPWLPAVQGGNADALAAALNDERVGPHDLSTIPADAGMEAR